MNFAFEVIAHLKAKAEAYEKKNIKELGQELS